MGKKKTAPNDGARVALLNIVPDPNQERIAAIKQWYVSQAIGDNKPVAVLNIAIMADGEMVTQGVHLEPEHAQAMLPELARIQDSITEQLRPAKPVQNLRKQHFIPHNIRLFVGQDRPAKDKSHERIFICAGCSTAFHGWRSQELRIRLQGIEPSGYSSLCQDCHSAIHSRDNIAAI